MIASMMTPKLSMKLHTYDCQMETLHYDLKSGVEVVKRNLGLNTTNVGRVINNAKAFSI